MRQGNEKNVEIRNLTYGQYYVTVYPSSISDFVGWAMSCTWLTLSSLSCSICRSSQGVEVTWKSTDGAAK